MGNNQGKSNFVKQLGITPNQTVSSKQFTAIWSNYDKNKNRLTYKQAQKFLTDFSKAAGVSFESSKATMLIESADKDNNGYLTYQEFKNLFFSASNSAGLGMTSSLKAVLTDIDDDDDEEDEKPMRTSAFMDLKNLRTSVEQKHQQTNTTNTNTKPNTNTTTTKPTTTTTTTTTTPAKPAEPKKDPLVSLGELWQSYKDVALQEDPEEENDNIIRGAGFLKFVDDLGVQNFEQDPLLLLVAWKLEVNQQHVWEISKEEFLNWNKFGCSTIEQMKKVGNDWKTEMSKDQNKFRNFYFFVFDYLRQDKKVLAVEEVVAAWEMLGIRNRWALFQNWVDFLKTKQAVSRDEWRQLYTFMQKCGKDFSGYSADDVWPSKFDEFVEWTKKPKEEQAPVTQKD